MPRQMTWFGASPAILGVAALVLAWILVASASAKSTAEPAGVFMAPSNLDSANGTIRLYDSSSGSHLRTLLPLGGYGQIQGLTLGPDGALYGSFFDSLNNSDGQILRLTVAGKDPEVFVAPGSGGLFSPSGLGFGPDGNLYVVNNRGFSPPNVLRFNGRTGAFIDVFATGLVVPQDLVFGPDGKLYVSNGAANSVSWFDGISGVSLGTFIPTGSGGLNGPIGLVFGPDGDLFIASAFTNSVKRFNGSTGAFVDDFASIAGHGDTPTDLAFGPDGNLYVVSRDVGTSILRFNGSTGAFIDVYAGGLQTINIGLFFAHRACTEWNFNGSASGCFPDKLPPAWWRGRLTPS
jgi:DNA-binding beta-propeller fold protein YncE